MTLSPIQTLLLVDDSKVARLSLIRQIKTLDAQFELIQASNADEALLLMKTGHADAALIDFNMPGRDGLELASELKASHPSMKMALVTANIQQPLVERAQRLGLTFLAKPTHITELAQFLGVRL
ncbi:response regulator transcription factor [Oceanisphaera avium]|uniref:Response regulator n=1 Tax=Oceanisphaera avium TaxID=1903694 RepID=A0A1Y0CWL5_9GAMM|nr:response regulator [Oceanisphaera avium]ART79255.1 response regulator [Oceanisphaera avium]